MIAKQVPMRSVGKSDFAGLAEYISNCQNKDHRLGQIHVTNCEASSIQDAITEVLATQHLNTRAKGDKTFHLIVSFRPGEQPSAETLRAVEERICAGLGYADHQRISAVHNDTDTVARDLSKAKLEARLGPFAASPEQQARTAPRKQYTKAPVRLRVNTVELYAKYKAEQQNMTTARAKALERARQRKDQRIEAVKRSNRLRRAVTKLAGDNRANKKVLYGQASRAMRSEIAAINQQYLKERAAIYADHSRRTWADWLKKEANHGDADALAALRAREGAGLKGNTLQGQAGQRAAERAQGLPVDGMTKKGTVIYRAGMSAVRDDGDRLQVSRDATREGLHMALRLAVQKYGEHIAVTGTVEFKAQVIRAAVDGRLSISFSDPVMESRRKAWAEKIRTQPSHVVAKIGQRPPPVRRHRLSTLNELDVMRIGTGPQSPSPVPRAAKSFLTAELSNLQQRAMQLRAEMEAKKAKRQGLTKGRGQ